MHYFLLLTDESFPLNSQENFANFINGLKTLWVRIDYPQ